MPPAKHAHSVLALPRSVKRLIAIAVDASLCALALWLALCLRLEGWVVPTREHQWAAAASMVLAIPIFLRFSLYSSIFRLNGWKAMNSVIKASAVYGVVYALAFSVIGVPGVPRTVGILQPILLFLGVATSRVLVRLTLGDVYRDILRRASLPGVLIYGAGNAGQQLARALAGSRQQRLVGFVDDDPALQGRTLDAVPIYSPRHLDSIVSRRGITDVLLAMPTINQARRVEIVESLRRLPVHVRALPTLADLTSGQVTMGDVHELDVADLLGRPPVAPDPFLLRKQIADKVVLVTGAGGSIGSELCRQILACRPNVLLLVEVSEHSLYQITQELMALKENTAGFAGEIVPLLGSVTDYSRMAAIVTGWKPDTVYHAAAYKHVPLVEHNVCEGVRNNVFGTLTCARVCLDVGVRNFVMISTDKAVRPTNIMGASKRLSEMILQGLADTSQQTCFTMVRFGNVLGSSGSVVPLFRKQIAAGGPITLTHRDITRYFMTIPEASQLVLQAGAMAIGGDVFVLDMGEPVKILDLAKRMVELCGLRVKDENSPTGDIEIRVTGLRPGEKLFEELLIDATAQPTAHPRILKARETFLPWPVLSESLKGLEQLVSAGAAVSVRDMLAKLVAGYTPASNVVDWMHCKQDTQPGFSVPRHQHPSNSQTELYDHTVHRLTA
jgi:FlaA1/EpsC-like NDP-sugar epimerase